MGNTDKFDDFKDAVQGHYHQQQASNIFNKEFFRQWNAIGGSCYLSFTGLTSANQVIKDVGALFGALQTFCQRGVAKSVLLKYADEINGVAAWKDLIEEFGNNRDKESRIDKLKTVINIHYTKSYKGGLRGWIMDYRIWLC